MDIFQGVTLVIAIIAVAVAFWQGFLAKNQLSLSKDTNKKTQELLDDIDTKVDKIGTISDETRKDVREQVSKLIDKHDENFKTLLHAPQQSSENEMMKIFVSEIIKNPELLKTVNELNN